MFKVEGDLSTNHDKKVYFGARKKPDKSRVPVERSRTYVSRLLQVLIGVTALNY
jgi:hypothetical protein